MTLDSKCVSLTEWTHNYVKTRLQLAFPAYIIILVAVIIKLGYHFTWFGRLVGRKDPVATLATLILLSYTKLLQTIITSFSSAMLTYPDGSRKTIWLPDATIEYFTLKHALLFCTAILILLLGLAYTLLLFTWQWVLCLPRRRVKWIRNPKLCSFLEIYHVPYAAKHRYWTGLLLFIRVIFLSYFSIQSFRRSQTYTFIHSFHCEFRISLHCYIWCLDVQELVHQCHRDTHILQYHCSVHSHPVLTW